MLSMDQIGYYLYMDSQEKAEKARLAAAFDLDKERTTETKEKISCLAVKPKATDSLYFCISLFISITNFLTFLLILVMAILSQILSLSLLPAHILSYPPDTVL